MSTPIIVFLATVVALTDGDTMVGHVNDCRPDWLCTHPIRVYGIDTPEKLRSQAKCELEVQRGLAASRYAKTLLRPGDQITATLHGKDKYGRWLASVTLPDGRDFALTMTGAGYAAPYYGKGPKPAWCTASP